jgi:hypothetical protein
MSPFSDLASSKVGAFPTQQSLNDALWKLCSLALKINLADITFSSVWAIKFCKPFISSLGKCSLSDLNISDRFTDGYSHFD